MFDQSNIKVMTEVMTVIAVIGSLAGTCDWFARLRKTAIETIAAVEQQGAEVQRFLATVQLVTVHAP